MHNQDTAPRHLADPSVEDGHAALYARIDAALGAISQHTARFCCCVFNAEGQEILFFRSRHILPCSAGFCRAKAYTAHAFQADTRQFTEETALLATIKTGDYCFLAGGIMTRDLTGRAFFIGLSSDRPELDHQAARDAARALLVTA